MAGKRNIRQSRHPSAETNSSSSPAVLRQPLPPLPSQRHKVSLSAGEREREIDTSRPAPPPPQPLVLSGPPRLIGAVSSIQKGSGGALSHGLSACEVFDTHTHTHTHICTLYHNVIQPHTMSVGSTRHGAAIFKFKIQVAWDRRDGGKRMHLLSLQ